MALVKFGSLITDTRGKIAGQVFKGSRFGVVLTTKMQTAKLLTPKQSVIRCRFETLSKRWWEVLTPTQRTDWRDLAAANPRPNVWGDDYPLTGLSYFISVNSLLLQAGLNATDDAPADQFVTAPATATLTVTAPATASLAFTAAPVPADHIAYLSAIGPLSPGVSTIPRRPRFAAVSAASQTSPWTISSAFSSLFGTLHAGRQYAALLQFLNTTNGAISSPLVAWNVAS